MESEVRSNGNRCQFAEMTEMNAYNVESVFNLHNYELVKYCGGRGFCFGLRADGRE